jgi:hypothetical protein
MCLSEKGLNSSNSAPSKDGGEELDQVAGNTEDEIGDLIASVREDEMMYSPLSLLATFGPVIAHICLNPAMFKVCVHHAVCRYFAKSVVHSIKSSVRVPRFPSASLCVSAPSFARSIYSFFFACSRLPVIQTFDPISSLHWEISPSASAP